MKHAYTEKQLIRFLYKECDIFERIEMECALDEDSTLLESYNDLREGYLTLPKVMFSPNEKTIRSILEYSNSSFGHTC